MYENFLDIFHKSNKLKVSSISDSDIKWHINNILAKLLNNNNKVSDVVTKELPSTKAVGKIFKDNDSYSKAYIISFKGKDKIDGAGEVLLVVGVTSSGALKSALLFKGRTKTAIYSVDDVKNKKPDQMLTKDKFNKLFEDKLINKLKELL